MCMRSGAAPIVRKRRGVGRRSRLVALLRPSLHGSGALIRNWIGCQEGWRASPAAPPAYFGRFTRNAVLNSISRLQSRNFVVG